MLGPALGTIPLTKSALAGTAVGLKHRSLTAAEDAAWHEQLRELALGAPSVPLLSASAEAMDSASVAISAKDPRTRAGAVTDAVVLFVAAITQVVAFAAGSKAGAVEASEADLEGAAAPQLPPFKKGGKTAGVLRTASGDTSLISGYKGPSASMPRGTPGMNYNIKSHVEAHAAALMREQGIQEGMLFINNEPCKGVTGCAAMLPRMLPEGARLRVVGPNGYHKTFVGIPDKQ